MFGFSFKGRSHKTSLSTDLQAFIDNRDRLTIDRDGVISINLDNESSQGDEASTSTPSASRTCKKSGNRWEHCCYQPFLLVATSSQERQYPRYKFAALRRLGALTFM